MINALYSLSIEPYNTHFTLTWYSTGLKFKKWPKSLLQFLRIASIMELGGESLSNQSSELRLKNTAFFCKLNQEVPIENLYIKGNSHEKTNFHCDIFGLEHFLRSLSVGTSGFSHGGNDRHSTE